MVFQSGDRSTHPKLGRKGFGEQDVMETKILDRNINREIVRELARLGVRGACGEDENLSLYKLHDTSFIVKSFSTDKSLEFVLKDLVKLFRVNNLEAI